jgi:histidinol-phosphate/aromatic aminotransferase/cobyric acid decarboxylase-like protein
LQAVKCHAVSNAKKTDAKPRPTYANFLTYFFYSIYSFSEREKIKVASFPSHDDNLLRVSIEKQEQSHEKIIENILKLICDLTAQDIP